MRRPPFIACSRPALEAAEYAKTQGCFDQFHLAVFKAYFEDCRNIGQRSVLLDIAERSGLDGDELERCLDEGWYVETIDKQNKEARELGISGAPTFVIGGNIIVGIQPYAIFAKVVAMVQYPDGDHYTSQGLIPYHPSQSWDKHSN